MAIEKHAEVRFIRADRTTPTEEDVMDRGAMSDQAVTDAGAWLNDQAWWVW